MIPLPLNVYIDTSEYNFTLTEKKGFQRYLPVMGEDSSFLFKVDVNNKDCRLGFKSLVKHINIEDYSEEELNRFARGEGLKLQSVKESSDWKAKMAAIIFKTDFAFGLDLRELNRPN
ncbi:hypothetical protein [Vibrio sp. D431a]|uniref:hypothetical protein n=1 Tax=Vibrio sp. D431a TaxID=2837388 RepID=UPI0025525840|nr:hypothetical protein [Vibrio sp. D431a]MDK9790069.1 hypothetical protein [Vibrio sp. D431a]